MKRTLYNLNSRISVPICLKILLLPEKLFSFDQVGISFFRSKCIYGVLTVGKGQAASGYAKNLPAFTTFREYFSQKSCPP